MKSQRFAGDEASDPHFLHAFADVVKRQTPLLNTARHVTSDVTCQEVTELCLLLGLCNEELRHVLNIDRQVLTGDLSPWISLAISRTR